jgi:hypothetical protein
MEHIKHDGAAELVPVQTIALSGEPPARRHRAVTPPTVISKLHTAREAVRDFLVAEFQAREVRITKIGPSPGDPQGWYAEAEIMVPDFGIMTLGLPLSQEVLERELCAIDLDSEMTVKSCEVLDSRDR